MSGQSVQGWAPAPWFLISAPEPPARTVARTRLVRRLDDAVRRHRVTSVTAPPGYGKTVAVGQWAERAPIPVAWLTLTPLDDRPARLYRGVVSALQELADVTGDERLAPLLGLRPDLKDLAASTDALAGALEKIPDPIALVIDDAHLSGDALAESVVATLAEHGDGRLRIVLVGTTQPALPAGLWLSESLDAIGPDVLAFDVDEVRSVAAAIGRPLSSAVAVEIHASTGGWPAAVHLTLMGRDGLHVPHGPDLGPTSPDAAPDLTDYIADGILGGLPDPLAEFVLAVTTCSLVDAGLAATLSERDDSAALLEECRNRGLFLDRFVGVGNRPVYRWHDLFAEHCRRVLRRRDPGLAARLDRVAARAIADEFPLRAISHALSAGDHELAVEIVHMHWVGLVLRSQAASVEALCTRMPAPWNTDPGILIVRACCLDVAGDRVGAAMLFAREAAVSQPSDERQLARLALTRAAAGLMLVDDHAALMDAVDALAAILQTSPDVHSRSYGPLVFLLGWAELRLRRDPGRAVALLQTARRECEATGDHLVAHRAAANLGFALAFGGRFTAAAALLDQLTDPIAGADSWQSYDGGVEQMTAGFVAYYRNELVDAEAHLRSLVDGGVGDSPYVALARIYLTFVACDLGDAHRQLEAERGLARVSDLDLHGVPWGVYKTLARCKLAEARGQTDEALRLAGQLAGSAFVPVTTAMVAESLRRAGDTEAASELLVSALAAPTGIGFIDASSLLTRALIEWAAGNVADAHRLMERSLDLAAEESAARPFGDSDPVLRELLVAHVAWGTHHEGFLAARIAQTEATVSRKLVLGSPLSRREHEVLGFLRTSMTTAEIAEALYVSVNTIKTHQRAIYRKLGVANRREAVRVRV